MGRKKRKQLKPWCWYCNREFDDEKILIQHQKAKHFKCPYCHRKLYTGPGLSIHCSQVHKEKLDKIPNSLPNRSSTVIDIYGMAGIPEVDLIEHERNKFGLEDEPVEKQARVEEPVSTYASTIPSLMSIPALLPTFTPSIGTSSLIPPSMQIGSPATISAGPSVSSPATDNTTPKATFPAYSEEATSSAPIPKVPKPVCGANITSVDLVHPEDDLSLEELRMQTPKYKRFFIAARATMPEVSIVPTFPPPPSVLPMPTLPPVPHGLMPMPYGVPTMPGGPPMPYGAHAFIPPVNIPPGTQPMPYGTAPPPWGGMPPVRF